MSVEETLPGIGDGSLTIYKAYHTLLRLGLPTAISFCGTTLANTIAFPFVGAHSNDQVQAAHALGYTVGNVLVLMIGLGLINGMDTLSPLAIGAGRAHECWAHLLQALAVVGLSMVPIIPMVFFSTQLLIFIKQDAEIAFLAGQYLKAGLPGLMAICIFETIRKFLIYHHYTLVQTIVSLCSIPIQTLLLWIFVQKRKLGALGAGIARSLTWIIMCIGLLTYIIMKRESFAWSTYMYDNDEKLPSESQFSQERQRDQEMELAAASTSEHLPVDNMCDSRKDHSDLTLPTTSTESIDASSKLPHGQTTGSTSLVTYRTTEGQCETTLQSQRQGSMKHRRLRDTHWYWGMGTFLKIAIPSAFLSVIEWISFEIQIFEAAHLGTAQIGALSSSASLGTLIFFASLSIGVTVNSQVGKAMGKRHPQDSRTFAKAGILGSISVSLPIASLVLLLHNPISRFFSGSSNVRSALRGNLVALSGVVIADSLHVVLGGAMKALGLQWNAAVFDFIGLLGIMQAIGLALAYKTGKSQGFVIGTATGLVFVDLAYSIMLFGFVNWEKRSKMLTTRRHDYLNSVQQH